MKTNFAAFFFIALMSELGTSWLVRYRGLSSVAEMVCFRDLGTMMIYRLVIWLVLFLLLSAIWLLLSRGSRTA
jgi:hypothetical protein